MGVALLASRLAQQEADNRLYIFCRMKRRGVGFQENKKYFLLKLFGLTTIISKSIFEFRITVLIFNFKSLNQLSPIE